MTDDEQKSSAHAWIQSLAEPRRGQVYRHAKGGLYTVVSVSIDEQTLEVLVTYTSNLRGGDTTRKLPIFRDRFTRIAE